MNTGMKGALLWWSRFAFDDLTSLEEGGTFWYDTTPSSRRLATSRQHKYRRRNRQKYFPTLPPRLLQSSLRTRNPAGG